MRRRLLLRNGARDREGAATQVCVSACRRFSIRRDVAALMTRRAGSSHARGALALQDGDGFRPLLYTLVCLFLFRWGVCVRACSCAGTKARLTSLVMSVSVVRDTRLTHRRFSCVRLLVEMIGDGERKRVT